MKRSIYVLVVDNQPSFRALLNTAIELIPGLRVAGEASNGIEAIEKVRALNYDLIVMDYSLPGMDGIEVARWIRQLSPHTKVVIMSEHRSRYIVEKALRSGAGGYLVKSDAPLELRLAVDSVLFGGSFISSSVEGQDQAESDGNDGGSL